jgi:hypothetical protein
MPTDAVDGQRPLQRSLNDFRFRSPATTLLPKPGDAIIVSARRNHLDLDHPATIPGATRWHSRGAGSYVINAALTGLTLRARGRIGTIGSVAFIGDRRDLASPLFSLNEGGPGRVTADTRPEQPNAVTVRSLIGASRLDRARDRFDVPARFSGGGERTIRPQLADKPADWF